MRPRSPTVSLQFWQWLERSLPPRGDAEIILAILSDERAPREPTMIVDKKDRVLRPIARADFGFRRSSCGNYLLQHLRRDRGAAIVRLTMPSLSRIRN
jgi:hypothetical protein